MNKKFMTSMMSFVVAEDDETPTSSSLLRSWVTDYCAFNHETPPESTVPESILEALYPEVNEYGPAAKDITDVLFVVHELDDILGFPSVYYSTLNDYASYSDGVQAHFEDFQEYFEVNLPDIEEIETLLFKEYEILNRLVCNAMFERSLPQVLGKTNWLLKLVTLQTLRVAIRIGRIQLSPRIAEDVDEWIKQWDMFRELVPTQATIRAWEAKLS